MALRDEISRRRTFAIISHPDAGKTTLTEKFLLYGGALQLAGSVTAKKNQRSTTSDWMELERKRGISVSSTVLQFEYGGFAVNLLDTPGHQDFSEDTYRVLTAVDAVIMVIDAGKGIESQTRKLFEVCRRRGIPIFTFMNKCDRPTMEPLALLDELENVLGIGAYPMNWPLGTGPLFKGVYDRQQKQVHMFERTPGGKYRAAVSIADLNDPFVRSVVEEDIYQKVSEEVEMLEMAGASFDLADVLSGKITPVFFGSAVNNFGVQLMLDTFLKLSAPPAPRQAQGRVVPTDHDVFSGFVFKIQANMDPKHRDRIAFIRICSGKFTRDMSVFHVRSGKKIRLSSSHKLLGQERETANDGYAGDIIGLVGYSDFTIGDTLAEQPDLEYSEIPRFAPECFAYLHNPVTSNYKRFRTGLDQLLQEGVVQSFELKDSLQNVPLLGAVGPLQFEVVQARMEAEYGAETRMEAAPWNICKWMDVTEDQLSSLVVPNGVRIAFDTDRQPVLLLPSDWILNFFREKNPDVTLSDIPPERAQVSV
jgi:peptide chain release factor 3